MRRLPLTIAGLAAALVATTTAAATAATWTSTGNGSSGGHATTLAPPSGVTIAEGACNGGNNQYKATISWASSASTFASGTYNVKFAVTSGGPYTSSWGAGSGTSPLVSTNNQFTVGTTYYVVVQAKVGSSWVSASAQQAMSFTCA